MATSSDSQLRVENEALRAEIEELRLRLEGAETESWPVVRMICPGLIYPTPPSGSRNGITGRSMK